MWLLWLYLTIENIFQSKSWYDTHKIIIEHKRKVERIIKQNPENLNEGIRIDWNVRLVRFIACAPNINSFSFNINDFIYDFSIRYCSTLIHLYVEISNSSQSKSNSKRTEANFHHFLKPSFFPFFLRLRLFPSSARKMSSLRKQIVWPFWAQTMSIIIIIEYFMNASCVHSIDSHFDIPKAFLNY